MTGMTELRLNCTARREVAKPMRHAVAAFLAARPVDADTTDDILTAVGEALANAVEHAYDAVTPDIVELHARFSSSETLDVDIYDRGRFIEREPRAGRGFGMRIVKAIAKEFSLETGDGTHVHMVFDAPRMPIEDSLLSA